MRIQGLFVLMAILLTPWAGLMLAQPATNKQPAAAPAADGSRTVVPANLYVDDNNAGAQDGSALRPFRTVQQAIDAAKDKDVIAVAGGTYPENIRVQESRFASTAGTPATSNRATQPLVHRTSRVMVRTRS